MQFIHIKIKYNFITADMTYKILIKITSNIFERHSSFKRGYFQDSVLSLSLLFLFPRFSFSTVQTDAYFFFVFFLHFPNGCCWGNHHIRAEKHVWELKEREKKELEQKPRTFCFRLSWTDWFGVFCFVFVFTQVMWVMIGEQYFILPERIILLFQKIILHVNRPCM